MIHSKQHGARSVLAARRLLAGDFFSKTETLWGGNHGSQRQAHYICSFHSGIIHLHVPVVHLIQLLRARSPANGAS
jgi:hypothetical protein